MTRDVLVVTPTPGTVASSYMQSVLALQAHDRDHDRRVAGISLLHCGAGRLPSVRNAAVRLFLDSSGLEMLWMIDSDMGFAPDTLDRLIACDRVVTGALCQGLATAGPDGLFGSVGRPFHTVYGPRNLPMDFEPDTLTPVYATGAACLLVHRTILETIGARWFDPIEGPNGEPLGEDLSFCARVRRTGHSPYVHTGVRTSHYQHFWI